MTAKLIDLLILSYHLVFEFLWVMRYKFHIAYSFGTFKGRNRSLHFGHDVEWNMSDVDNSYADRAALIVFRAFKLVGDMLWLPKRKKPLNHGWWTTYHTWMPEDVMKAMHSYYGIMGERTVLFVDTNSREIPPDTILKVSVKEIGPDGEKALGYELPHAPWWDCFPLQEEHRLYMFDKDLWSNLDFYQFRNSGKWDPSYQ